MFAATDIPADAEWFPSPKWIRGYSQGQKIVDSRRAMLMRKDGRPPVYYFPKEDIDMDALVRSEEKSGRLHFWHMKHNDQHMAWELLDSMTDKPELVGYTAFEWTAMDAWFEEDEEVFVHARDPKVRIDTVPSSRHIQVEVLGAIVADTRSPVLLFETGLRTRYYIPKTDLRLDLLESTERLTRCPYKGEAHYYSVNVGEQRSDKIAWYYRYPTSESFRIASMVAFYDERVDALYIDGEKQLPDSK